jgi:hypothetical protein
MWSVVKRSAVLTAVFLVCATGSAGAAPMEVKVPFPFVVEGHTLPAGQYAVERDGADPSVFLIRGEKGVTAAMFVLTMPAAGRDPAGDKPALTFARHETQYRLADIWAGDSEGREIMSR